MKHLFVPYELAVKLKENNFKETCFRFIYAGDTANNIDHDTYVLPSEGKDFNSEDMCMSIPLYQQVTDWFREKHHINIRVACNSLTCHFAMNERLQDGGTQMMGPTYIVFKTYYDALTYGIEEALKFITNGPIM